ncbi:MAG: TauD/TfdA family dioxygenase [Gammaproteobacteria bacterium]|nr:TauD/TfdA family dioxygenase [Gammaproteobacteria bacterium]
MEHKTTSIQPFGLLLEPKKSLVNLSDLNITFLRELIHQKHLLVLRGFRTFQNAESFANYCERWGEISMWPFGKVLELIEQDNPPDHIFDHRYVPLHWDGMYRPQIPELQIFHCVEAPQSGQGGRTTFSNTILALKYASPEAKKIWNQVTGTYQRKMEFYNSKTVSPIINKHPYKDFSVIRYNEPPSEDQRHFVNPPELKFMGINLKELADFHYSLKQALYASCNFYAHEWQTGDVVIADNFSLLHGREEFISKSPRHLQRVHILSDPPFNNPGLEPSNEDTSY